MTNINHCLFLMIHGAVLPVGGKLCMTAQLFPLTFSLTTLMHQLIFQLPLPFLLLPNPLSLFSTPSAEACYLNLTCFMPLFLLSHQQLSLSLKLGWILLSLINKFSFLVNPSSIQRETVVVVASCSTSEMRSQFCHFFVSSFD